MANVSFEEVVRAWLLEYDDRVPNERADRKEAFAILLGNLAYHNFNKEDLTTSRKEKIVRSCVNPYHRDRNKLKKWTSMVVNDLEAAALIYYGTVDIDMDILPQSVKDKLAYIKNKEEEQKAQRPTKTHSESEESAVGDEGGKPLDLEETPLNLEEEALDVTPPTRSDPKVIEATDEMLGGMEGPEPVWDEELMKELGVDFDE